MVKLNVQSATPAMIRVETNTNDINQVSGIESGITAFSSLNGCKITSTSISGIKGNLQFYTSDGSTTGTIPRMTISELVDVSFTNNIIGNGTAISNLKYSDITNKPSLTGYATIQI